MPNLFSTLRRIAASAAILASASVAPSLVGGVDHASASLCGYSLAASTNIIANGTTQVGVVKLWMNQCNFAMHTQTLSTLGTQSLRAAVTINGTDYGLVTSSGTSLNTDDQLAGFGATYKGHGCVSVYCAYTAGVV